MLPSVSGDLLLHLVAWAWTRRNVGRFLVRMASHGHDRRNVGALLMRMRYSRTKPLRRKRAKSVYQSQALPFCYAWRRQDLHSACAEHYRNGNYETLRTVVDAFQSTQRRLDCTYAVDRIASTPRVQNITETTITRTVVDAFQTTLAPPTSTRLPHTYAVDRIANTTTSCRKASVSLGNAMQKSMLRIWYGLFCMSIRALYFLFVLFTSNVVRVLSNSLSLLAYVCKPPLYVVCKMYFTAISLLS